ncbi:phage portal protein [bacterium]|nr:phage portal protein [bacterium]
MADTHLDEGQQALLKKLRGRQAHYGLMERYYDGDAPLPESAEGQSRAYRRFQRKARLNLAQLSVAAVRERMVIGGFRTGAEDDENGDREARRLWKANHLDYLSADLHSLFLRFGSAYAIVGYPDGAEFPVVTVEDPRQVCAYTDPAMPNKVVEAIKVYQAGDYSYIYCYRPELIQVFVKDAETNMFEPDHYQLLSEMENTLGEVPVVKFTNADERGEYEPYTDIIDRANHMILQRLIIATTQAFRQRVLKGDFPTHDQDGNEIDYNGIFESSAGSLWMIPEGADVEELAQAEISGILQAVRADIQDFAAVTRTPMHYFAPEGVNGSAEGAQLAREGLVFKTEDRIARASAGWSKVMSLVFMWLGDDTRAALLDLEPLWKPAERYSLAERADANTKFADVPFRSRMSLIAQFSPAEIEEMESEKASESLVARAIFTGEEQAQTPQAE